VEIGQSASVILVRDTEDRSGAALALPRNAWQAFTATLK
jgi:hypothetical protein